MYIFKSQLAWLADLMLAPVDYVRELKLVIVMLIVPTIFNIIYFWLTDSMIKLHKKIKKSRNKKRKSNSGDYEDDVNQLINSIAFDPVDYPGGYSPSSSKNSKNTDDEDDEGYTSLDDNGDFPTVKSNDSILSDKLQQKASIVHKQGIEMANYDNEVALFSTDYMVTTEVSDDPTESINNINAEDILIDHDDSIK